MSEIKHKPWEACGNLVRTARNEDGSGGFLVAECSLQLDGASERAKLFAAAPALLEALQLMVKQFTKTPSSVKDSEARGKAHAAIAKATGALT